MKKVTLEQQLKDAGVEVRFETSVSALGTKLGIWFEDKPRTKVCLHFSLTDDYVAVFDYYGGTRIEWKQGKKDRPLLAGFEKPEA